MYFVFARSPLPFIFFYFVQVPWWRPLKESHLWIKPFVFDCRKHHTMHCTVFSLYFCICICICIWLQSAPHHALRSFYSLYFCICIWICIWLQSVHCASQQITVTQDNNCNCIVIVTFWKPLQFKCTKKIFHKKKSWRLPKVQFQSPERKGFKIMIMMKGMATITS